MANQRDDHSNTKERIRVLESLMPEKVQIEDFDIVQQSLKTFPSKSEVVSLRNELKSSISKFMKENKVFQADF